MSIYHGDEETPHRSRSAVFPWARPLIVLIARRLSVAGIMSMLRLIRSFTPRRDSIITWAGLRGGLSVVMALSLPPGHVKENILVITHIIVVFSTVIQGLTPGKFTKRILMVK